jgi:flagella basal body P-ring formation protein FlgA
MSRFIPAALLAACVLSPTPTLAATLRPMTTLSASVVLLSDLFDDAGTYADRVLGPGPAPGERIVVEASQLSAIARMYGVDWHPISSGDRAVLERPGHPLPRESVLAPLRAALARVGGTTDLDVTLPGFEAPMIPAQSPPEVTVEQLDYDAGSSHFTASVLIAADGLPPLRMHLAGQTEAVAEVPVPVRRLSAGSVITAADLTFARVPIAHMHGEVAHETAQAVGFVARRGAAPGQALSLADLVRPGVVHRGGLVQMQIQVGGLTATAQGTALADGAPGDRIRVLNPSSHMVVEGEVQANGIVVVAPDSLPVPAGAQFASVQGTVQ